MGNYHLSIRLTPMIQFRFRVCGTPGEKILKAMQLHVTGLPGSTGITCVALLLLELLTLDRASTATKLSLPRKACRWTYMQSKA